MKRFIALIAVLVTLLAFGSPSASQTARLQAEPALQTQVSWDLLPSGMLTVAYDLDYNGRADFFTVRLVLDKYISEEPIETVARWHPGHPVFRADYGAEGFYYIAARHPLFYALDFNEDGEWDVLFKDAWTDGVNGNETLYRSASGGAGAVPGGEPPPVS